jgi:hypothetical protein
MNRFGAILNRTSLNIFQLIGTGVLVRDLKAPQRRSSAFRTCMRS